jgi:hypothetical protein
VFDFERHLFLDRQHSAGKQPAHPQPIAFYLREGRVFVERGVIQELPSPRRRSLG